MENIECVLLWTIHEIVLEVASYRIVQVRQHPALRSLPCTSEVRFQGPGTRIALANNIGIIGPDIAEKMRKRMIIFNRLSFTEYAEIDELPIEYKSSKHTLDNVCSV